jgi:hypothetical protein
MGELPVLTSHCPANEMPKSFYTTLFYVLIAMTTSCASCDEETNTRPKPNPKPMEDMADMGPDDMREDMAPDMCRGAGCGKFESFDACPRVKNLGVLKVADGEVVLEATTAGLESSVSATCSADGEMAPDYVYALEVDEPAFINTSLALVGDVDWVVEARAGKCEAQAQVQCLDSGETLFYAEPGKKYFLVLEPVSGTLAGPLKLTLNFTPLVCAPPGSYTCDMGTRQLCEGGTRERALVCGAACEGAACAGDTCETALPIMGVAGTYTFEGTLEAFSNTLDTANMDVDTCALGTFMGMPSLATPGPEVFYALRGMKAGQRVRVDAKTDLNDNAIYLFRGCAVATTTCLASDDLADAVDFTVPEDGDYTLVVDVTIEQGQTYKHTITITD